LEDRAGGQGDLKQLLELRENVRYARSIERTTLLGTFVSVCLVRIHKKKILKLFACTNIA
jgi:S-adenosylmethionine:diacylglycerol 3-amino-3-carboxypropyl transferase